MNGFDALRDMGLVAPVEKIKPISDPIARSALDPFKDCLRGYFTACNQPVAVLPFGNCEETIGCNCVPKRHVVKGSKPLFNILNIFEHNHKTIIPQPCFCMQFQDRRSPQHEG